MKVQVLGPGCSRCERLYENAVEAAGRIGSGEGLLEVEKVKDLEMLYNLGVFITPALVIDGQVVSAGKLLSVEEVEAALRERQGESSGGAS